MYKRHFAVQITYKKPNENNANKQRLLEIMLMLIICEIVNKRYSFSVVAKNNEKCVKKGKKNRMRGIRLK